MNNEELEREIDRTNKRIDNISRREIQGRKELMEIRSRLLDLARDSDDRLALLTRRVDDLLERDRVEEAVQEALKRRGAVLPVGFIPRALVAAAAAVAIIGGIRSAIGH